ncbi:MAG: TetR/AcrR family transcriptional regulator [Solirubrobacterales bacterium]
MGLGDRGRLGGPESPHGEESGFAAAELRRSRPARKLKPGPGLTADVVFADQRRRLREAAIELIAAGGYERATVRALSQQAGVSTRTFYRQFANVADCVGFASEATMLEGLEQMREAASAAQAREEAFKLAIASLTRYFASHPDAASVALIEAFDAGPPILVRTRIVTGTFEQLFTDLLDTSQNPVAVPRQLVTGMVAGVMRIARATTMAGRADELPALAPGLSRWALSLATLSGEKLFRPFALTRSGNGLRRETNPFPDSRRLNSSTLGGDDRDRILRATVRLAAADGFAALTIPQIRRVAGVSRQSFNHYFASVPECFLAAVEWLVREAAVRARAWAIDEPNLDRRTHRLVLALCAQVARNNALAGLGFAGVLEAGRDGLLCRERILATGAENIRRDLQLTGGAGELPLEASVAAAWRVADVEVAAGRASRLPGLSALLTQMIMVPVRSLAASPAGDR